MPSAPSAVVMRKLDELVKLVRIYCLCPINRLLKRCGRFFQDRVGGGSPDEGAAFGIVVGNELIDLLDQFCPSYSSSSASPCPENA